MRKILLSLLVIAVVASVAAIGISGAWFSDIQSTGENGDSNTLLTGAIELDPITPMEPVVDLKPCLTGWSHIVVHVVDNSNPGLAWLHIKNVIGVEDGAVTHAEQIAYDQYDIRNDVDRYIDIDLKIDDDDGVAGGNDLMDDDVYTREIISPTSGWTLAMLDCIWIPLGALEEGHYYELWLSFHVKDTAGNLYQADKVTFDMEVLLQQQNDLNAPQPQWPSNQRVLRLENKDSNGWTIFDDATYGMMTYNSQGATFDYAFEGYGLADVAYSLIYYADPWAGNNPGALIGSGTASGGTLSLSGSVELSMSLPKCPEDANCALGGAKIWLVTSADYVANGMTAWNPLDYLYETRLITYTDM